MASRIRDGVGGRTALTGSGRLQLGSHPWYKAARFTAIVNRILDQLIGAR